MIGEGSWVAAEVIGDGVRAETGRRYLQHYSFRWRMGGGRILEIRVYEDTLQDWDVWQNLGTAVTNPNAAEAGPDEAAPPPEWGVTGGGPSDPEANKEVVRRFLMSFPVRDAEIAKETWASDGVWSFALGGEYLPAERAFRGGQHWSRDEMIRMQQKTQIALREPLTFDLYAFVAEGNRVAVEAISILVRPSGAAYRQHDSFHFTLRGGRICEAHSYGDTLHGYDLNRKREKYAPVPAPLELAGR
jgi:ketosteroid isomerase-like protein